MEPIKTVPYYNRMRHKIILDAAVAKAVSQLTGHKSFSDSDAVALSALGINLVHINDITKRLNAVK